MKGRIPKHLKQQRIQRGLVDHEMNDHDDMTIQQESDAEEFAEAMAFLSQVYADDQESLCRFYFLEQSE
jgi:hypothetical protein